MQKVLGFVQLNWFAKVVVLLLATNGGILAERSLAQVQPSIIPVLPPFDTPVPAPETPRPTATPSPEVETLEAPSTKPATPSPAVQEDALPRPARAPQTNPDEFPINPLEIQEADPLIPTRDRPLSPLERRDLIAALDALNLQATALHKAGEREQAYDIWFRELRLRRFLGLVPELQALGRVGSIVWGDSRVSEVRWIAERLDTVLTQAQTLPLRKPTTPDAVLANGKPPVSLPGTTVTQENRIAVLEALGAAYQQIRFPQRAVAAYELILADASERGDAEKIEQTQITLAQLYLGWFKYPEATAIYQALLATAQNREDVRSQIRYLTTLAYIHEQAKQPDQAIPYQVQLVELYQKLKQAEPLPLLYIRLGDNYQLANRFDLAEQSYQTAYKLAQPQLQFGNASEALQKLGALYRANDRLDAALRVYTFLLDVEQLAYNAYGTMNAYDQLGQIYLLKQENPQALAAFQRGLQVARQLSYREDYFLTQIQKLGQPSKP